MNPLLINRLSRIAIVACVIASPLAVAANGNPDEPGMEGTWVTKVTSFATNPPTTNYSIATFLPGGQIIEDNSQNILRTVGQGEWQKVGPSHYMRSLFFITFVPPRTFNGITHVINDIQLNDAGDEYDALGYTSVYDVNGNLTATRVSPSHGRRCTVDMTIPECMGVAP
jgi:hypothetical protein